MTNRKENLEEYQMPNRWRVLRILCKVPVTSDVIVDNKFEAIDKVRRQDAYFCKFNGCRVPTIYTAIPLKVINLATEE